SSQVTFMASPTLRSFSLFEPPFVRREELVGEVTHATMRHDAASLTLVTATPMHGARGAREMSELSRDAVLDALKGVIDPVFEKPMLDIDTLFDVDVKEGTVSAKVRVASPSERLRDEVRARVEKVLAPLGAGAELAFESAVPTREVMGDDPVPGVKNVILVMSGKGGVG